MPVELWMADDLPVPAQSLVRLIGVRQRRHRKLSKGPG